MSPTTAFLVLTWGAIVVLFFGLAAVLREVRLLRGLVTRGPDGFAAALPDLRLGQRFATGGGPLVVLAADSGCPLCLVVADLLARRTADGRRDPFAVTLLTHEPAQVWDGIATGLDVISDRESWRSISHLSPPVLMLVDGSGRVRRMILPVRAQEVEAALAQWRDVVAEEVAEEVVHVADVRTDS
jgi:hypothetical protein